MNLRFIDVVKRYNKKCVLDEVSFNIASGSCVGLVGNNGCGKTTTIEIMCNLLRYEQGEYLVNSTKVTPYYTSFKKEIGMLLSKPSYIESFTIDEYWRFVGKYQGLSKSDITTRIDSLHNLLSTNRERKEVIRKLSSGNKMKVSIGAALIHNPETFILDEPFVNLDVKTTHTIVDILRGFKKKKTMVITSHDLDTIANLCDEFLIMDQGKIILRIHRENFTGTETLKEEIKARLTGKENMQNLAWLG